MILRFAAAAAVLALVMAACAGEEEPPAEPTATEEPTTSAAPAFTTLTPGVLQVASCLDYQPFEWIPKGTDEPTGFDVELTEEIASRLGLTVEWITHDFDTVFTALAGDQFDMVAAAVTATGDTGAERDEIVDFGDLYYSSRQGFIVNEELTPDLTSYDQLNPGDVVGVQKGTTGQAWAQENLEPEGIELKAFTTVTPIFQDLEAGNIVAMVSDEPQAVSVAGTKFPSLGVPQGIDTNEFYAFAFSESNPELTEAANSALQEIIADGTYAALFEKYFPDQEVQDPTQYQT
jgi:ABC-type amino acid transport substrate-binding protein